MDTRDYSFVGYQVETENGLEWIIEFPDLEGVVGGGITYEEALNEAEDNKKIYLSFLTENNMTIPLPKKPKEPSKLSGRLTFRMSKTLHKKVLERAGFEEVSVNQIIYEAVTAYIEREKTIDCVKSILTDLKVDYQNDSYVNEDNNTNK